jgi:hypothetical protein
MSKLHIEQKVGKYWSNIADGDGTLSSTNDFVVAISSGNVKSGNTYKIKQGQSTSGDLYDCRAVNGKNATFHYSGPGAEVDDSLVSKDNFDLAVALKSALDASVKKVTIKIDLEDLKILKTGHYNLCFAKKVGDEDYNVVWQSYSLYLFTNEFSWTPQYQLFGTNIFQDNITVRVSTNVQPIGLGEICVLDGDGILGGSSSGGPSISLSMNNQYGSIRPGVNQLSTGIDGSQVSTPIYVAPQPIVKGTTSLTPVEKVMVWFEQKIETSTMFSNSRALSVEIDLTFANEATRLYKDQQWVTP